MEPVTIVVMPRDKFSVMERCLDDILKNTPEPFELWVLSGGTPEAAKKRWQERYASRAKFTFFPEYRNGADLRDHALDLLSTKLAVFVDNDVYVRPGWLEALVRCQRETGAAMVTPLILDRDERIHTAGGDFILMKKNGTTYASMELRYQHHRVLGALNLTRRETDLCEIHCTLVDVAVLKKIRPYDKSLREFQEMDSSLSLSKNGCRMMFEPESVVYLFYEDKLTDPQDMRFHMWKWDMRAMHEGFDHFKKKWGYDINPNNSFDKYLRAVNRRVGFFSRRWPSAASAKLDQIGHRIGKRSWAGP